MRVIFPNSSKPALWSARDKFATLIRSTFPSWLTRRSIARPGRKSGSTFPELSTWVCLPAPVDVPRQPCSSLVGRSQPMESSVGICSPQNRLGPTSITTHTMRCSPVAVKSRPETIRSALRKHGSPYPQTRPRPWLCSLRNRPMQAGSRS